MAAVLKLFGASSLEECRATYGAVGNAERVALDDAIARAAEDASAVFLLRVDAALADGSVEPTERPPRVEIDFDELEREYEPSPPAPMLLYSIQRRLFAIGRSYVVRNADGIAAFDIRGKLRFARVFTVRERGAHRRYVVREKLLRWKSTFVIFEDGFEIATVERNAEDEFEITLNTGQKLQGTGDVGGRVGVVIRKGSTPVATVHRQQNILRERFSFQAAPDAQQRLMLAIAMAIVETDLHRGGE